MCGIAGILNFNDKAPVALEKLIILSESLGHRGPDDEGYYVSHNNKGKGVEYLGNFSNKNLSNLKQISSASNNNFKLGLVHRRFSILDTSSLGHQPMLSNDRKVILTFNGEIFNYIELRNELISNGYSFNSNSDTEVVLNAYKEWGIDCLNKFNGFWAIGILDLEKNICVLSRDRFGQKPLYYFQDKNTFYFSSEINSLRKVCPKINRLDERSAYLYLYHDRKDSLTQSMYKDLCSIKPSTYVLIDLNSGKSKEKKYWDYPKIDETYSTKSIKELSKELNDLVQHAVKIRLRSDVPVAANLSGGLDSATIVYHASELLKKENKKLTTHTFEYKNNEKLSEKNQAASIANQCNTDHDVLYFDSNDVWKDLKKLVKTLEEPVHSPAAYIQWIAWKKIADMGFKVILHGASNDELMMGYTYFAELIDKYRLRKSYTIPSRMQGNSIFYYKNPLRIIKWCINRQVFFKKDPKVKNHPKNLVFNRAFLEDNISNYNEIIEIIANSETGEKRRIADFKYLRIPFWNNFMDKSMMSIPIEVRLPFLDKNVVEFCFKNSSKIFYKKGWPKYLLRKSLNKNLSDEIIWDNRKKGFTSPKGSWLSENKNTNLKILKSTIGIEKFVDVDFIEKNYKKLNQDMLWRIINFCIWVDVCKIEI